jgi:hypothetical protein
MEAGVPWCEAQWFRWVGYRSVALRSFMVRRRSRTGFESTEEAQRSAAFWAKGFRSGRRGVRRESEKGV